MHSPILYNDAGTLTLVWSAFDPAFEAIVGRKNPWVLTVEDQAKLENQLVPAPSGGRWRFKNPPRCKYCGNPIGDPIGRNVYYLFYNGSIDADGSLRKECKGLIEYLQKSAT